VSGRGFRPWPCGGQLSTKMCNIHFFRLSASIAMCVFMEIYAMESAPEFVTPAPNLQFSHSPISTPFPMGFRLPTSVYYGTRKSTVVSSPAHNSPGSIPAAFANAFVCWPGLYCHIDRLSTDFSFCTPSSLCQYECSCPAVRLPVFCQGKDVLIGSVGQLKDLI